MKKKLHLLTQSKYFFVISIFILIGISILSRLGYQQIYRGGYLTFDTGSYYALAQGIHDRPFDFFSQYRTPMYPLVLNGCFSYTRELTLPIMKNPNLQGMYCTILFQQLISVLALILGFFVVYAMTQKKLLSLGTSALIAIHPLILPWERMVLTESLSMSWMLLFFTACFVTWKRMSVHTCFLLLVVSIIGILLRPSFLPIPIIAGIVVFLHRMSRLSVIYLLFFLSLVGTSILIYTVGNYRVHGIRTFQIVSSINILGRFMVHDLPITGVNDPIAEVLALHLTTGGEKDPYVFIDFNNSFYLQDIPYLRSFISFTQTLLLTHFGAYIASIPQDIPRAISDIPKEITAFQQPYGTSQFVPFLQKLAQALVILQYGLLLLFPLFSWKSRKNPTLQFTGILLITLIGTGLFSNLFFAYTDYARLVTSNLPLLHLYCAWMIVSILYKDPKEHSHAGMNQR